MSNNKLKLMYMERENVEGNTMFLPGALGGGITRGFYFSWCLSVFFHFPKWAIFLFQTLMDDVWACTAFRLHLWRFGDLVCHFINSPGSLITVPAGVLMTAWGQFCASCFIRSVGSGQIPHSQLSVPQARHILTFKKDECKMKIARSSKEF